MLVLLPPSEGKAVGTVGPALDLESLSFPELTPVRALLVDALSRLAVEQPAILARALGLTDGQRSELDKDARLRSAPTLPARRLYTGVIYDNLDLATMQGPARRRATSSVVVASALFGLLRPGDRVPSYRLSGGTTLPGLGRLRPLWRPVLEPLLAKEKGLVVDLRSVAYAQLARAPRAVEVRVLREQSGQRTTVSHDNKWTKGKLARALCEHGARTPRDVAELGRELADAVEVDGHRVDLVLHGLAAAR